MTPSTRSAWMLATALMLAGGAPGIPAEAEHRGYLEPRNDAIAPLVDVVSRRTAHPNYVCRVASEPDDPLLPFQAHLGVHDAGSAWEAQGNANGVLVAVLDTGVAYEFWNDLSGDFRLGSDLAGTMFQAGWDFVNDDAHPNDDHHHGTFVAGIIAQTTNNHRGAAGLAQGATILPVKVLDVDGQGTLDDVIAGIIFAADSGADVIVMSFAFPAGVDPGPMLDAALEYAESRGCLLVGAAGNEGVPTVAYPAASPRCIAVGAVRTDRRERVVRTRYSNWGPALDVVAFGGDGADRNGDRRPDAPLAQAFWTNEPDTEAFYFIGGTSSAAATAGATLALLRAAGASPALAAHALLASSDDLERRGFDTETGFGLVDPAGALALVEGGTVPGPGYATTIHLAIHVNRNKARLVADVQVLDASGQPARDVRAFASFRGRFAGMAGDDETNAQGRARIVSDWLTVDRQSPGSWEPGVDYGIQLDRLVGTPNHFDPGAQAPIDNEPGANVIIDVPIKERSMP